MYKIPSPTRDEMMRIMQDSWDALKLDPVLALKNSFLLNALDGSEDHLVTHHLIEMVGAEIKAFREELISSPSPPPKSLVELLKAITPLKGVIRKGQEKEAPPDEGLELFDCK